MKPRVDRRCFLQSSGLLLASAAASPLVSSTSPAGEQDREQRIRKAVGWDMIAEDLSVEDKFRLVKDAGFEGVEAPTRAMKPGGPEPQVLARASEKIGVAIHGVSHGSHPDLPGAIDEAAIYGATSVLYVVRSDPKGSFLENYRRTQQSIRAAIPHAEKKGIPLLIENVWATFLVEPLTMARYIDELGSPYVQAYFDVGNSVRFGLPQHWIEVLGKRIGKIHIKEYNLKVAMKAGMLKGFDFPLGQGDIDWPRVCEQLERIQFRSWATAEMPGGDRRRLADISAQMDNVLRASGTHPSS